MPLVRYSQRPPSPAELRPLLHPAPRRLPPKMCSQESFCCSTEATPLASALATASEMNPQPDSMLPHSLLPYRPLLGPPCAPWWKSPWIHDHCCHLRIPKAILFRVGTADDGRHSGAHPHREMCLLSWTVSFASEGSAAILCDLSIELVKRRSGSLIRWIHRQLLRRLHLQVAPQAP